MFSGEVDDVIDDLFGGRRQDAKQICLSLRTEQEIDELAMGSLEPCATPGQLVINIVATNPMALCPHGVASGLYQFSKNDASGMSVWESKEHHHSVNFNRAAQTWTLLSPDGWTVAETCGHVHRAHTPQPLQPHQLDWAVRGVSVDEVKMTVRGELVQSTEMANRFKRRMDVISKVCGMRHPILLKTQDRASLMNITDRVRSTCRGAVLKRIIRFRLMARRGRELLSAVRTCQQAQRMYILKRNAMWYELYKAWCREDELHIAQTKQWTVKQLENGSVDEDGLQAKVTAYSSPNMYKKAAIVHLYMKMKKVKLQECMLEGVQRPVIREFLPVQTPRDVARTLKEARYMLTQLENQWRDKRLQATMAKHEGRDPQLYYRECARAGQLTEDDRDWSIAFRLWVPATVLSACDKNTAAAAAYTYSSAGEAEGVSPPAARGAGAPAALARRSKSVGPMGRFRRESVAPSASPRQPGGPVSPHTGAAPGASRRYSVVANAPPQALGLRTGRSKSMSRIAPNPPVTRGGSFVRPAANATSAATPSGGGGVFPPASPPARPPTGTPSSPRRHSTAHGHAGAVGAPRLPTSPRSPASPDRALPQLRSAFSSGSISGGAASTRDSHGMTPTLSTPEAFPRVTSPESPKLPTTGATARRARPNGIVFTDADVAVRSFSSTSSHDPSPQVPARRSISAGMGVHANPQKPQAPQTPCRHPHSPRQISAKG